jgi:hypothetical protein
MKSTIVGVASVVAKAVAGEPMIPTCVLGVGSKPDSPVLSACVNPWQIQRHSDDRNLFGWDPPERHYSIQ